MCICVQVLPAVAGNGLFRRYILVWERRSYIEINRKYGLRKSDLDEHCPGAQEIKYNYTTH